MRCCCCAKKTSQELWRIKIIRQTAQVWRIATQTFMPWWVVVVFFAFAIVFIFRSEVVFFFFFTRRSRSVRTQRGCSAKGGLIGLRGCVTHTVAKLNHRSWDPISLAPSPSLRLIDWQPKRRRRRSATAVYRYRRRCFAKNQKTVLITIVIAKNLSNQVLIFFQ